MHFHHRRILHTVCIDYSCGREPWRPNFQLKLIRSNCTSTKDWWAKWIILLGKSYAHSSPHILLEFIRNMPEYELIFMSVNAIYVCSSVYYCILFTRFEYFRKAIFIKKKRNFELLLIYIFLDLTFISRFRVLIWQSINTPFSQSVHKIYLSGEGFSADLQEERVTWLSDSLIEIRR